MEAGQAMRLSSPPGEGSRAGMLRCFRTRTRFKVIFNDFRE
jgi:hypothetical protein